jgi:hypothetical protein
VPSDKLPLPSASIAVATEVLFHELAYYTLAQPREEFIHQYVVDAFAAQTASAADKPIRLVFALVGLYLHVERGCNGREVQRVHMELAQHKRLFPEISIPVSRDTVTITDVLNAPPGPERDRKIEEWCESVWAAYSHNRNAILGLLDDAAPQKPRLRVGPTSQESGEKSGAKAKQ